MIKVMLALSLVLLSGCTAARVENARLDEILSNPDSFKGRMVRVDAAVALSRHEMTLLEACDSKHGIGLIVPNGHQQFLDEVLSPPAIRWKGIRATFEGEVRGADDGVGLVLNAKKISNITHVDIPRDSACRPLHGD